MDDASHLLPTSDWELHFDPKKFKINKRKENFSALLGVQEVPSSNLGGPTKRSQRPCQLIPAADYFAAEL